MTFSIAARCPRSLRFAVAVASSSPAVAARCAHARAGVGAVLTQNVTDPRLGSRALDLLALGAGAADAVRILRTTTPHAAHRQLAVLDTQGEVAGFSGARALGRHAIAEAPDAIAAGNLLADEAVPAAMLAGFAACAEEDLAARVLAAMRAGLAAGGEVGPIRSAGLLLVDRVPWPVADLRIDWHDAPVAELDRLWAVWRQQLDDYVTRALDPDSAPGYGVPGGR